MRIAVEYNWSGSCRFADFGEAFGIFHKNVGYFKIFHGTKYLDYVSALFINLNYWQ